MFDILYSITTYNRSNYAIQSINDLLTKIPDNSIVNIKDDGSTDHNLIHFLTHIDNLYPLRINVTNLNGLHSGVEHNNVTRCDIFGKEYDDHFVYLSDDDVMYSTQFLNQLMKTVALLKSDHKVLGATLFETDVHPSIDNYNDDFCIKKSLGGCSLVIRVKDFKEAMNFYSINKSKYMQSWDFTIGCYAQSINKVLISPKFSYVQHIGKFGVNSRPNRYDFSTKFIDVIK